MTTYTVEQIERAINIWREREGDAREFALGQQVRVLAAPYAFMCYTGRSSIDASELSVDELDALRLVLEPPDSDRSE